MFLKKIPALSISITLLALPVSAAATSFSNVIVIGDSLSDSGNAAIATAPAFQPVPFGGLLPMLPYENGRLTNGPIWVETLATSLGLSAFPSLGGGTNFAFGGAKTGPLGTIPPTPPSLLDQFAAWQLATGGIAPSDALYVVWGGSNNLIFDAAFQKQAGNDGAASATISQAVNDLTTIVGGLAARGAVNFIIPNVTNLGRTPYANSGIPNLNTASTAVSVEFNTLLSNALSGFRSNPNLNFIEIDSFGYVESIIASPASFGLTNVNDPCVNLTTVCANPDQYLFYDGIHPTATIHRQFAQFVRIQIPTVPESSSLLGIGLALGLGLLSTKRQKVTKEF
jgi:phospholipase/lecithinase/hemolysin